MTAERSAAGRDPERLALLHRLALLDTPAEAAFDRLGRLAARLLRVPVALVSLMDGDRQFFMSSIGLPEPWSSAGQLPLSHSFCQHIAASGNPLVIEDARVHPLVRDNLAARDMDVIAYAGVPLVTAEGHALGTFCAIDSVPRAWTAEEMETLRDLAASAMTEIELRLTAREVEQRTEALHLRDRAIAATSGGMAITDPHLPDNPIVFANPAFKRMTGYTDADVIGHNCRFLQGPDTAASAVAEIRAAIAEGRECAVTLLNYRKDGTPFWNSLSISPVRDAHGEITNFVGIQTDVTSQKESEHTDMLLAESRAVYAAALAIGGELDLSARLERVLDAALGLTGSTRADVALVDDRRGDIGVVAVRGAGTEAPTPRIPVGQGLAGVVVATNRPVRTGDARADPRTWRPDLLPGTAQGSWLGAPLADTSGPFGVLSVASPLADAFTEEHERVLGAFAALAGTALREARLYARAEAENAERLRAEEALARLGLEDPLTGLPNRVALRERLAQEVTAARDAQRPLALLVLDLDRFREINDALGHQAGDVLLRQVARRFADLVRDSDTLARLGGDEFAGILPATDGARAVRAAEAVLRALQPPFDVDGRSVTVEASIGVALYPQHGSDPDTLLRRADVALYVAKRTRSRWALYSAEQDEHSPDRLALLAELRGAGERGELVLHYQPKVSLPGGQPAGVEALVRWAHPQRGMVPPGAFIPLAEETGLIGELDLWVLGAAARQARAWHREGRALPIAVNLSMRNLHDARLPDMVADLLSAHDVPPQLLKLEITEGAAMADPAHTLLVLERLRAMGIGLSIDDFGTGYSSLGYLKRLPVDELKVDQSFVRDMVANPSDTAIVRATIDMAHALGLRVVAEGVEDRATLDLLGTLRCNEAQGYFIGRPMPPQDLATWLRERADTAS